MGFGDIPLAPELLPPKHPTSPSPRLATRFLKLLKLEANLEECLSTSWRIALANRGASETKPG